MEAIKLDDLCADIGVTRNKLDEMRRKLGIKCAKRDNVWTITTEEAEVLRRELGLPKELQGETYEAFAIQQPPNKNFLLCKLEGYAMKQPVLIPRRFHGKLLRKKFPVEKIEDGNGVTWRHEWFRKLESYRG